MTYLTEFTRTPYSDISETNKRIQILCVSCICFSFFLLFYMHEISSNRRLVTLSIHFVSIREAQFAEKVTKYYLRPHFKPNHVKFQKDKHKPASDAR